MLALNHVLHVHKHSLGQDVEWIHDGILKHMKNKPKTRIQSRNLGMLAALLVSHGAVLNQVYLALEEWNKCSISTIKRGHYPIGKEFSLQGDESDITNKMFMMQAMFLPYLFESQIEKPFPRHKRYETAYDAFHKAKAYAQHKAQEIIDLKIQIGLALLQKEKNAKKPIKTGS